MTMPEIIRTIAHGTLKLSGPTALLEAPSGEEVKARLAAVSWRTDFDRFHAEGQHKLGLIETRVQLDWHCAQIWMKQDFPSYARAQGVSVEVIVKSRARILRP